MPNDLKLSQHVVDMYKKICGNFWVDTYIFRHQKKSLNFKMPYEHGRLLRAQKTYKIDYKTSSVIWL